MTSDVGLAFAAYGVVHSLKEIIYDCGQVLYIYFEFVLGHKTQLAEVNGTEHHKVSLKTR